MCDGKRTLHRPLTSPYRLMPSPIDCESSLFILSQTKANIENEVQYTSRLKECLHRCHHVIFVYKDSRD